MGGKKRNVLEEVWVCKILLRMMLPGKIINCTLHMAVLR